MQRSCAFESGGLKWRVREVSVCSGLIQPFCFLGGLASVDVHSVSALLAPHSTAPVEFALTLGDTGDSSGVIPSAAAHDLTAVCPFRCLAADSACSAQGACSLVQDTVVWGVVKVDKVSPGGTAIALAGCCEVGAILGGRHLHSSVIAPPQVIPCAAEV